MTQNTSHAVMAQRAEPHDSLDDFPSPPWSARALMMHVMPRLSINGLPHQLSAWEPAANRGYMLRALQEFFSVVWGSDIHDYGAGYPQHDFLQPYLPLQRPTLEPPNWIITNPPFRLGAQFILRALEVATTGVAMLVRTQFIEGAERHKTLFKPHRPAVVAPFVERVPMVKGRYDPKASTATSYCWIVWTSSSAPYTEMVWIPPCRKELERQEDFA